MMYCWLSYNFCLSYSSNGLFLPNLAWFGTFFPSVVILFFFFFKSNNNSRIFIFPLLVYFCVVLCFLCGLCPRVESLFVVVACDHGICISQDESIGTEFGCTGWLSGKKDRFNVTIIQYSTILTVLLLCWMYDVTAKLATFGQDTLVMTVAVRPVHSQGAHILGRYHTTSASFCLALAARVIFLVNLRAARPLLLLFPAIFFFYSTTVLILIS